MTRARLLVPGLVPRDPGRETFRVRPGGTTTVSLRPDAKRGALGNEIAIMNAPLPVGIADPVERLAAVRAAMEDLKSSKQAEGAKVLTSLENALPPAVLARASRLGFSSRLYNLLVTNVPGPQLPIYMLGRELKDLVPLAFLAPEHQLAIGIMSYNGHVTYGLMADADAVPDLDVLAKHLRESLSVVSIDPNGPVRDVFLWNGPRERGRCEADRAGPECRRVTKLRRANERLTGGPRVSAPVSRHCCATLSERMPPPTVSGMEHARATVVRYRH